MTLAYRLCLLLTWTLACDLPFTTDDLRDVDIDEDRVAFPRRVDATDERIAGLKLPAGFALNVFARNLGNARWMAVTEDGTVLVSQTEQGTVTALQDTDGDGSADRQHTVVSGLEDVHGLALKGDQLFVATPTQVLVGVLGEDFSLRDQRVLADGLPSGQAHYKRTLRFAPGGELMLSVGSSCNACVEDSEERATLLRVDPDTGARSIFARGLRNTMGFDWHPQTGALWGMDHGADLRGNNQPPEELNLLVENRHYGWPYVYGQRTVDTEMEPPPNMSAEEFAQTTEPSVLDYQAHSSPIGFTFYRAEQFPEEFRNSAFAAMRGSWNRLPPTGYKVIRIVYDTKGDPVSAEDFVTGWLLEGGRTQFGRVAGVAVAKDGSLLIAEDENGIIYRVRFNG